MIAYLNGKILDLATDSLILLCGGVGYRVYTHQRLLKLLQVGQENTEIFIYTHVREDNLQLFGFTNSNEERLFQKLMSVSGIGPKSAMAFLSAYPAHEIINAILTQDLFKITSISGVGKKTAERLLMELKDKVLDLANPSEHFTSFSATAAAIQETMSALVNLGYGRMEAERVLKSIEGAEKLPLAKLLKEGLKRLSL